MTDDSPSQPSCPECGAPATAHAKACAHCGYRFVQDSGRTRHPSAAGSTLGRRVRATGAVVIAVAGLGYAASLVARDDPEASGVRPGPGSPADIPASLDVLSSHPLSATGVEHLLEARFASPPPGRSAVARCSALQPRPAHAIRRCRIHHPGGGITGAVVMTNPRGQEILVDR